MTQKHLKFIDTLPCAICGGACGQSTHHHLLRVALEYQAPMAGQEGLMFPKVKTKGTGTKSEDRFAIPLCIRHHAELHHCGNEKQYLKEHGINKPEEFALALFEKSGQYNEALKFMNRHFQGRKKCSGLQNSKG